MDHSLYDEFGNYIGPEIVDDIDDDDSDMESEGSLDKPGPGEDDDDAPFASESLTALTLTDAASADVVSSKAVVPHEEKEYYPEAHEVYPGVETLVEDEDTQPLSEPIIAPNKTKIFDCIEKDIPETTFDYEYMMYLMTRPEAIRQICLLGHLHSGKTSFLDILVHQTHRGKQMAKVSRYSDNLKHEVDCGLSIKAVPISLILPSSNDKSYLFHILDTPGHVNFQDECTAAMRLCDGAVLIVDALLGVMCNTERLLKHALQENLSIVLVVNCIDRLILELRLTPTDAYFKLRHTIEEINSIAEQFCEAIGKPPVRFSPTLGNVAFASSLYEFVFTLEFFSKLYAERYAEKMAGRGGGWMRGLEGVLDTDNFVKCMWGNHYYSTKECRFLTKPENSDHQRAFVEFILNPLYKIMAHTVSEEQDLVLDDLRIQLSSSIFESNSRVVLKEVCKAFFSNSAPFVDMVVRCIPNPKEGGPQKVKDCYMGALDSKVARDMQAFDPNGTLMIHVTKSYHRPDCSDFDVLGRVFSGTVFKGQRVKILGETYNPEDREDIEVKQIMRLWVYQAGRYRVEVDRVPAGNWVLLGGISKSITKTATITSCDDPPSSQEDVEIFKPLRFQTKSVIRVSCEPLNPSELPKMLEGFRKIMRSYPICETKVEENGEHVILGTGELSLNCILHDLRKLYGDLEVKVADPVSQFCETAVETSALKCFAVTPNQKNKLQMVVEPLENGLPEEIENGTIKWPGTFASGGGDAFWTPQRLEDTLTCKYNWDILAARSVWAFGPHEEGPNMLINDTLPDEVDQTQLSYVKNLIVQGFQWVTREGPLIEETVRSCKFRLLHAEISPEPAHRGGGQLIPTTRRVAYSSFLLATPRLMEPILFVEIESPADCVVAIYTVLAKRRGHVIKDMPKPGTPIYIVHAYLPTIESFGFETDLRTHTSGQAFCLSIFDHWALVPGDPLNKNILLRPLEPAPVPHLAREFLLKTRRRKGLAENVAIHKFFDDPGLAQLAKEAATDLDDYF